MSIAYAFHSQWLLSLPDYPARHSTVSHFPTQLTSNTTISEYNAFAHGYQHASLPRYVVLEQNSSVNTLHVYHRQSGFPKDDNLIDASAATNATSKVVCPLFPVNIENASQPTKVGMVALRAGRSDAVSAEPPISPDM
jgi:hypothetical protein